MCTHGADTTGKSAETLKWRASNAQRVNPTVAHVARGAPALPASAGPRKCVFSHKDLVMTQGRSRLRPDQLQTLVVLKGSPSVAEKASRPPLERQNGKVDRSRCGELFGTVGFKMKNVGPIPTQMFYQ